MLPDRAHDPDIDTLAYVVGFLIRPYDFVVDDGIGFVRADSVYLNPYTLILEQLMQKKGN
jgi:hypothetical protein